MSLTEVSNPDLFFKGGNSSASGEVSIENFMEPFQVVEIVSRLCLSRGWVFITRSPNSALLPALREGSPTVNRKKLVPF